jgi:DNA-binding Xre family transcriptional regulator
MPYAAIYIYPDRKIVRIYSNTSLDHVRYCLNSVTINLRGISTGGASAMLDRNYIYLARCAQRLSQRQLGERIGQDQSYISRLERGALTEITVTTLERLAKALVLSPNTLLRWGETSDERWGAMLIDRVMAEEDVV